MNLNFKLNEILPFQFFKIKTVFLKSTVQVYRCQTELKILMEALPQFAQHFLGNVLFLNIISLNFFFFFLIQFNVWMTGIACNMLFRYSETCQAAYRGLVQPDSEDKRVISATWAKDEDINRFLR